MGFTTIMKAVMVLGWLCVAEAQQSNGGRQAAVIFPDDSNNNAQLVNNRQFGPLGQKPRCADNLLDESAPCLDDLDYNEAIVDRFRHLAIRFQGNVILRNEFFQKLTLPEIIPPPKDDVRDQGYDPMCASEETIIFPKRAKTRSNDWVFVLNQGKRKQAVKVEKCRNNNRPCNLGAAGTEVNSVCRQKYIYKKLLVMNGAGTDIVPESVLMPSCCVCYIKKERNFGGDFGGFGFRNGGINNRGNNPINGQRSQPNQFRRINPAFQQG